MPGHWSCPYAPHVTGRRRISLFTCLSPGRLLCGIHHSVGSQWVATGATGMLPVWQSVCRTRGSKSTRRVQSPEIIASHRPGLICFHPGPHLLFLLGQLRLYIQGKNFLCYEVSYWQEPIIASEVKMGRSHELGNKLDILGLLQNWRLGESGALGTSWTYSHYFRIEGWERRGPEACCLELSTHQMLSVFGAELLVLSSL